MLPTGYNLMSGMGLMALAAWREAQNQGVLGMRGVCWVINNRVARGGWWGNSVETVVLHPFQFSSFNAPPRTHITDPNESKWPADNDKTWEIALDEAQDALDGKSSDPTSGATLYWSPPLTEAPEKEWGPTIETVQIGSLHFCKAVPQAPQAINVDASDA
jgi:N-acetylmuramoyl-L-alanine amidase